MSLLIDAEWFIRERLDVRALANVTGPVHWLIQLSLSHPHSSLSCRIALGREVD